MVIDIHRHLVAKDWFSDNHWRNFARMVIPILSRMGIPATVESVLNDFMPLYYDTDGTSHLQQMKEAGIEKTALFVFDVGRFTGEPEVHIKAQNEFVFKMARNFPDQVVPFVHIDPRRSGAIDFVKKCVEEYSAKGLKLHPSAGFDPSGIETLNMIEAIAGYKIPVITHTGASIAPTSSKFCDPMYLDEMLLRFPEVNVIAAHMGYGHRDQLFALGLQRPNLYTEISAWQTTAANNYPEFAKTVRNALDYFGPERVLFGTDGPFLWPVMSDKDYVQAVRNLTTHSPEHIIFKDEEITAILETNGKNLLGL